MQGMAYIMREGAGQVLVGHMENDRFPDQMVITGPERTETATVLEWPYLVKEVG